MQGVMGIEPLALSWWINFLHCARIQVRIKCGISRYAGRYKAMSGNGYRTTGIDPSATLRLPDSGRSKAMERTLNAPPVDLGQT
jgi:hypothetical protein